MHHINVPYQNARTVQCDDCARVAFIELVATDARIVPYRSDLQSLYLP